MQYQNLPEIICRDDKWFLRLCGESVQEICLPHYRTMDRIWETCSSLLHVYVDDCGANLDRSIETLRDASKAFAGISQLLAEQADMIEEAQDVECPGDNL